MRVLSIVHEPSSTGGGGLFEEIVTARGDVLERWVMPDGTSEPGAAESYDAIMVFGGAMHPDQDAEHPVARRRGRLPPRRDRPRGAAPRRLPRVPS